MCGDPDPNPDGIESSREVHARELYLSFDEISRIVDVWKKYGSNGKDRIEGTPREPRFWVEFDIGRRA